jgi:hypothetical protein
MTKIRLINIFLLKSSNNDTNNLGANQNINTNININNNSKIKNPLELINLNNQILNLLDHILDNQIINIEEKVTELFKVDLNEILLSLNKEKTPHLNIDKLEEYQIYSNIKRGNKFFPFVVEFHIIIYHIHHLLDFKKSKEINEIFLKKMFNCYIVLIDKDKQNKYDIDLFNPDCKISSSIEKDYISIKCKTPLFLSSIRNQRDGINEFYFMLEFKDNSQYKYNEIKKIIFNIDI